MAASRSASDVLREQWSGLGLPASALERVHLSGDEPVLPSSFAVGTAAQVSLAAGALAAAEIGRLRSGTVQEVRVDMREAALECGGRFTVDGVAPEVWDPVAGLYECGQGADAGWVRVHTNFAHHRDRLLRLLGLPEGPGSSREQVGAALAAWSPLAFEDAATARGCVVAAVRAFDAWERHPQHAALEALPLVEIERIGDAPPLPWPALSRDARPLAGLRVLDLTRILAGPVAGRTLAAYGADVLLVNSPSLPNIAAIADTSRGKRSALADLALPADRGAFASALSEAHVVFQGYRPGSIAALGFSADDAARLRPGIVYGSLSAYGRNGPWRGRRGFDSLVQAATGFNEAEGRAAGSPTPKAMPMQILDMASGFLLSFGLQAALLRQHVEGGSWHVQVSLARTGLWLRSLGRIDDGFGAAPADAAGSMEASDSGFGRLVAARHAAMFSLTPAGYSRPSVRPGTDPLAWA